MQIQFSEILMLSQELKMYALTNILRLLPLYTDSQILLLRGRNGEKVEIMSY